MDNNHDVQRAPNATLRWVLRGMFIVAGAAIAWILAAAVSNASPLTDLTPKSVSSGSSASPVAKQITQTKKQLIQTAKNTGKASGNTANTMVNKTTSKTQKAVASIAPKPVQKSIDKVAQAVNRTVGQTTDTVTKIVDNPAGTIGGVVPSIPASTPTYSAPQIPAGNLSPDQWPVSLVPVPESMTLPEPIAVANDHTGLTHNQPVITKSSDPIPIAPTPQQELQTSFHNVVATVTNSVNLNSAGIAGILPLTLTVLLGFLYLGIFRELRGGVVKRPYLVPVTPD